GWRKKRPGSNDTASSGTPASTNWTGWSRNSTGRRRSMDAGNEQATFLVRGRTNVERASERELVVTRTFDGPARFVFEGWTTPALPMRWWAPRSFGITFLSCAADVRVGGTHRFVFGHPQSDQPMAFVGRSLDVVQPKRLVWTNEESEEGAGTTLT